MSAMSAASSAAPTFDELAELALAEMQRQQREQQQAIEHQIAHSPHATTVLMPGVPTTVTSSTVGGRTVIRKSPANAPSPTGAKALSTAPQPAPSPSASSNPFAQPPSTTTSPASASAPATTGPTPHDPSAVPPPPAAPAEEAHNLEIAHLNDTNVAALLATQKSNAHLTSHLSTALTSQLQSVQAQHAKLAFIRAELAKLDASLTDNINTLRTEIESVGREVLYAQAEFDRKEKEYLEARKGLAKVKQRKLLLTGHLDYIILTNEQEKATKLKELEKKLFGGNDDKDAPAHAIAPAHTATPAAAHSTATAAPSASTAASAGTDGKGGSVAPGSSGVSNGGAKAASAVVVAAAASAPPPAQPAFSGFGDDDSSGGTSGPGGRSSAANGQMNGTGKR